MSIEKGEDLFVATRPASRQEAAETGVARDRQTTQNKVLSDDRGLDEGARLFAAAPRAEVG